MRDDAASTVIGAVLLLGIVVGTVTVFRLTVVPSLTEEAEANHMETVAGRMGDLDADLLQQLRRTSQGPLSSTVPLARPSSMVLPDGADAALAFESATGNTTELTSPSLKLVERDGEPLLSAGGDDWQEVESGETIEDIEEVIGLRIKITDGSPSDEDQVKLEATDTNGDYAGDLRVITNIDEPDLNLVVATREPPEPGEIIFHNHILSIHQQRWDSDYWIDAMLDLYWFDSLLEDADKPASITFENVDLDAEYKVSYRKATGSGLSTIEGAGKVISDWERSFASGRLDYEVQNEYYVDQTLAVENGALVREQDDGSAFVVDPPFRAEANEDVVRVGLDAPALQGDSGQASGKGIGVVRTHTTERGTLAATAGELEFTFATQSPQLWANFLEDELTRADLTNDDCPPGGPDSACQFEIAAGSEETTLTLHGPHATDVDPTDPERDVLLSLQHGTIETEVQK